MEKYIDIIGLNDFFQPAYDLENELQDYWKQFIPNDKFYKALVEVLNSLEGHHPDEKKSLWLQGTYGTGKSHATAVIKHVLFDNTDETKEFIDTFEKPQLKAKLKNFRKKSSVFPVILKGTSGVTNNRTFALVIQRAVKNALCQYNINVSVKSDFETYIHHIENNPTNIEWGKVIENFPKIQMYAPDPPALIKKLKDQDLTVLKQLDEISDKNGIYFTNTKVDDWLGEVAEDLRKQGIADSLMIYWDEFTSVLELPAIGLLLTELQHISDLAKSKNVYLFMVSHRRPTQANIAKKELEKVLGRFQNLDYQMEPITTYHIVEATIKKKDRQKWEALRDEKSVVMEKLLRRIVGSESGFMQVKLLKNLFPIHPYTAYLSTFIARYIGSTERSIFNFLFDEEEGFIRFIRENPCDGKGIFLTSDYLWQAFAPEFERIDYERFSVVLDKFKLHISDVEKQNPSFAVVFKGLLLLNALYKMVSTEESKSALVAPSAANIKAMFWGTEYKKNVDKALAYLNDRQIIPKTPDDLYLVSSSNLPLREIEKEKANLRSVYNQIDKILTKEYALEIENILAGSALRESEIAIFDATLTQHILMSKLNKAFKKNFSLHIAVFVAKNVQEREQCRTTVAKIIQNDDDSHITFVVLENLFEEKTYDRFLDYKARAQIADRHNFNDERDINADFGKKVISQWIQSLRPGYLEWYVKDSATDNAMKNGKFPVYDFSSFLNTQLSPMVFSSGIDLIEETRKNANVWKTKNTKKTAEIFLFSDNREDLEGKTQNNPYKLLREILKTKKGGAYIVDEKLRFKKNIDQSHPLFQMSHKIENEINKRTKYGAFNLGDALIFLSLPPYGLYPNMVNYAAMGFLMKNYVGKLYETGRGTPIEKEIMRDKIESLLKYWNDRKYASKLDVRLGTVEEKKLMQNLATIFKLKNTESLNDVKWGIRNWIKNSQYPLWVYKLSDSANADVNKAIDHIIFLIESIDKELTYDDIKNVLNGIENVEFDLRLLFSSDEKSKSLFLKWLKGIDSIKLKDEETDELIDFIRKKMPEEIGVASWKEVNIKGKAKDWYIDKYVDKSKPNHEVNVISEPPPSYNPNPIAPVSVDKKIKVIEKIENFKGDFRIILKKIADDHPELIAILDDYLS